jgi:colanic acid/amylovoran biosynthesis protein
VISTLSQGVPCLGTSWAHKYAALYGEYGVPDWLLDNSASPESTASRLLQMKTEGPKHAAALSAKALEIGRQAEKMWGTVDQQLATVAGR